MDTTHRENLNSVPPKKKRRIACSECRQAKLRCGSDRTPCPRCSRLGLVCEKDGSYKRVNRQSKIDQLEQHISHLRDLMQTGHGQSSDPHGSDGTNIEHSATSPDSTLKANISSRAPNSENANLFPKEVTLLSNRNQGHAVDSTRPLPFSEPKTLDLSSRELGSAKVNAKQADSLFRIFFDHYHCFFPLLEPTRSPEQYFEGSPLLYWSIISVASRRFKEDAALLTTLEPAVMNLLWHVVPISPMTLPNVQAVVLLCIWPFPNMRFFTDKSLLLANIATTHALNIGLHRPGHEEEYIRSKISMRRTDLLERSRTWIACTIMAQSLAMDLGYPPSVSLTTWTIDQVCQTNTGIDLPVELRHNLIIQQWSNRTYQRLMLCESDPRGTASASERYTILASIEDELDILREKLGTEMSLVNRFRFRTAQLYAQNMYFLDSELTEERKSGILKAYSTASTLVSELIAADGANEMLAFAPFSTFRSLLLAAAVLWKVVHSTYHNDIDSEAGNILFDTAAFALRQASIVTNDVPIRAADALKGLKRVAAASPDMMQSEPHLHVQSRAGASILYDSLRIYREWKTSHSITGTSNPLLSTEDAENDNRAQLVPSPSHTLLDPSFGIGNLDNLPYVDWFWDYEFPSFAVG